MGKRENSFKELRTFRNMDHWSLKMDGELGLKVLSIKQLIRRWRSTDFVSAPCR